jgi:hypothetical protein
MKSNKEFGNCLQFKPFQMKQAHTLNTCFRTYNNYSYLINIIEKYLKLKIKKFM